MGAVLSLEEAQEQRRRWQERGERVVLTNGHFDLLHLGHVRSLQWARARGDRLIVAVNGDASTRALKGPGRPVVPAAERAELLAALGCVDCVLLFEEATAEQVVAALRPEVYVKSGDYDPALPNAKPWPEAAIVEGYGGEVAIAPYVAGHSTTELLAQIGQQQTNNPEHPPVATKLEDKPLSKFTLRDIGFVVYGVAGSLSFLSGLLLLAILLWRRATTGTFTFVDGGQPLSFVDFLWFPGTLLVGGWLLLIYAARLQPTNG